MSVEGFALAPMASPGEYLVVGKSIQPSGLEPLHFVRMNSNGVVLGEAALVDSASQPLIDRLIRLGDGRLVASGSNVVNQSDRYALLVEIDASGQPLRTHQTALYNVTRWADVVATPDSGYLALGMGSTQSGTDVESIFARFDAQGDTVWTRVLGDPGTEYQLVAGALLPQGDVLVVGTSRVVSSAHYQLTVQSMGLDGQLRWSRRYETGAYSARPGGVIVQGDTIYLSFTVEDSASSTGVETAGMLAMDTLGNVLRANLLSGNDSSFARGIGLTYGREPILLGGVSRLGSTYGIAVAMSAGGNFLWSAGFGTSSSATSIMPITGGYLIGILDKLAPGTVLFARTDGQGQLSNDCFVEPLGYSLDTLALTAVNFVQGSRIGCSFPALSTAQTGVTVGTSTVCGNIIAVSPAEEAAPVVLTPQPMTTVARLTLPAGDRTGMQLLLHDLGGKAIVPTVTPTADGLEIHRGGLPAGLYSYQVLQGGQRIASGKLWIAD